MRWRCMYEDSAGKRCSSAAEWRLHFSDDHPFNFVDACAMHIAKYNYIEWRHELREDWNVTQSREK